MQNHPTRRTLLRWFFSVLGHRASVLVHESSAPRLSSPASTALAFVLATTLCPALSAAWQEERRLSSPDGSHTFLLERDTATGALAWSVTHASRPVVTRGALGLELDDGAAVADRGAISRVETRSVDTAWPPPFGERSTIPDRFREETLTFETTGPGDLHATLQVRAYPEGIAFRYVIRGSGNLSVKSEKTTFPIPADTTVWTSSNSQGIITCQSVAAIKGTVERPLTAQLAPALFAAFGEAALTDQSRMRFALQDASTLRATLDGPASFTDTFTSAWRYVRASRSPAELLEGNHFVLNLNEPSKITDTSWLRPGKVLREITLTTQGALVSVDYAASHGLQFIMFDAGWYGHEYEDQASALAVNVDPKRSPGPLDLPAVIAAAKTKNIGVILYVNRRALEKQLDQILPLYRQWGVAGIKFGFVQTGSQRWTDWLHQAVAKCAEHQLMVVIHDDYRLTGVERTWPNLMTAEGVRGDEETPRNEDVLNTLFTRSLTGAADQTNCYFAPRVATMGSHASQLAKAVCLYSPWQFLFWYDRPPGALNGNAPRKFTVPLAFLDAGKNYRLELFSDDPRLDTPTRVRIATSQVDNRSEIRLSVASRNGLAAILTPSLPTPRPLSP